MARMADIAHVVGEAVSRHGVKLAFHTESHSTLWYERDIDLFMALTDPRYVWLCPDSCHIALGGGDPVARGAPPHPAHRPGPLEGRGRADRRRTSPSTTRCTPSSSPT